MTKPQQMMETVKFYCYRDLYKTCYSLKQNAFFHITVQKKKKKICFTIFRQINYRQQQKKNQVKSPWHEETVKSTFQNKT